MPEIPFNRLMLLTTGLFLSVAALRWHKAAAAAPDRIVGVEGPTAVLLVQAGDCPQRRAAMMRWLSDFAADGAAADRISVALGVLREGTGPLDDRLTLLPRLDEVDTRSAARAALRSGIEGTPALLLVDVEGIVLLAGAFTPEGLGPRWTQRAALLSRVGYAPDGQEIPELPQR